MRITFVLPYAGLQGGIRVVAIYADRLTRRGHHVTVVSTPHVIGRVQGPCRVNVPLVDEGLRNPETSHFDGVDVEHRRLESVRPVTDADVPDGDIVVATYYTTASGVLELSPRKGTKAIFIQGYEVKKGRPNPDLDATWRAPFHKIAVSRWLVELARDRFADHFVSLVPNSVDVNQFYAAPRGKNPLPVVGLLYSSSWFKGMNVNRNALKKVAARMPTLRVVAFGAEEPGPLLPPEAEFHHRPPQEAIREIYAQCDVWMCGSNSDGFHLPLLEAMACRCPVVSTRVGAAMDLIEEDVNGYVVDVNDGDALADRVLHVLNLQERKWKGMSDAALRTATSFSWDDATDLFEKALWLAIERQRRGELSQRSRVGIR
jgi:glycosyltransferase involved in cell wall biosynthesis